ncbi:MAG: hypothetical protein JNJ46_24870 [Myxococcales bacterium]|nr:hypothetical protein [Myxococcales bacterium]
MGTRQNSLAANRRWTRRHWALGLSLVLGMGCAGSDPAACDSTGHSAAELRDYERDAKPLLERYCTTCHREGGIAPFALSDYESARVHAAAIADSVKAGRMPPWMPSKESVPLRYSRAMADEDKAALLQWVSDGAQAGEKGAAPRVKPAPADVFTPPRRDLLLDPMVTYQPNTALNDDYRCFILDPAGAMGGGMPEERYIQATNVRPGNDAIVHHVILFEVPASKVATVQQKDAAEAGPGFTCFGGAGTNSAEFVTGWAPGGVPQRIEPDMGLRIRKGSVFVMQVHYNLQRYRGQGDRTTIEVELAAEAPPYRLVVAPLAYPEGLHIKAGHADASQSIAVPVSLAMKYLGIKGTDVVITSVTPHMHMLGTSIATSLGAQTLVDIPRWDFHWQQAYMFQTPIAATGDQLLLMTCMYDNSAANQPVINGVKQIPRDVTWGEGTLDEMCLSFLGLRIPRLMGPS